MVVIVTCKNEEFLSKNEGPGVVTTVFQVEVYGNFPRPSRAAKSAEQNRTEHIFIDIKLRPLTGIILPAKSKSDVMFCLQSYGTYLS